MLAAGSRLVGTDPGPRGRGRRRAARATRKDRGVTAILHTGFPVRHWDHELGAESPRLLVLGRGRGEPPRTSPPDAGFALTEADYSISADAVTVAASWRTRGPRRHRHRRGRADRRGHRRAQRAGRRPGPGAGDAADRAGRLPGGAAVQHPGLVRHPAGVRAADRADQGGRAGRLGAARRPAPGRVGVVGRLPDPVRRRRPARPRRRAGRRPGRRHGPPPARRGRGVLQPVPVARRPARLRAALGRRRRAHPGAARHRRRGPGPRRGCPPRRRCRRHPADWRR